MAPLKHGELAERIGDRDPLPCLKRHGSIEAVSLAQLSHSSSLLPCLKRHGSIEASARLGCEPETDMLTMSEKTWLH